MSQKWNLQDIRPPEARRPRRPIGAPAPENRGSEMTAVSRSDIPSIVIEDGSKKRRYRFITAGLLFILIIGAAFGIALKTGQSILTVYPEYRSPVVNDTFTAFPEQRQNELSYELLTLTDTSESQVMATGQVPDSEQATGLIEIIKTTPGSERLIKNTRFRSPSGLIFRIQESVVVPGAMTDASGTSVPGTIQAAVFAEEPGEQFNLPSGTRFDIPGFQESGLTQLYETIYAENRSAFTGGFDGLRFEIADDELNTATQALQMTLRDKLLAKIESARPAGFVYFPESVAISFNSLPPVKFGDDLVTIREEATLQVPLFRNTTIGSFLAQRGVVTYTGGPVVIDDITTLRFSYQDESLQRKVLANEPSLTFSLDGTPLLIWQFDSDALAKDVAGLNKNVVQNVFESYPALRGGRVHLTPFWRREFPADPSQITITQELVDPR